MPINNVIPMATIPSFNDMMTLGLINSVTGRRALSESPNSNLAALLMNSQYWTGKGWSSMLEALDGEYIKMARIKGLPEWKIVWKHTLKNALIPVLTFGGSYLAAFITGAILVETVFAWPGVGRLVYDAIIWRDFPVLQSLILMIAAVVISVNLIVDILYAYIDPRIRYA